MFKRIQLKKYLFMYKNLQYVPLQWDDKMEYVSTQNFMRCASKQCLNDYHIKPGQKMQFK